MRLRRWGFLAAGSLTFGAVLTVLAGMAMIAKGGSHVDYCPRLPDRYWIPCMPSWEGITTAMLLTVGWGGVAFAVGAVALLLLDLANWIGRRIRR